MAVPADMVRDAYLDGPYCNRNQLAAIQDSSMAYELRIEDEM